MTGLTTTMLAALLLSAARCRKRRRPTRARPPALLAGRRSCSGPARLRDPMEWLSRRAHRKKLGPRRHDRIFTSIVRPSLRVLRPAKPNGAAVIVAPGGAYQRVVIDKEGQDVCAWLNGLGITAFALKYRLPDEGHANGSDVPLQDGQRAIRLLRSRAQALGSIPPRRDHRLLGGWPPGRVPGGILQRQVYVPRDEADRQSAAPISSSSAIRRWAPDAAASRLRDVATAAPDDVEVPRRGRNHEGVSADVPLPRERRSSRAPDGSFASTRPFGPWVCQPSYTSFGAEDTVSASGTPSDRSPSGRPFAASGCSPSGC